MKMRETIIKMWITAIIFGTMTSNPVKLHENLVASVRNEEIKHTDQGTDGESSELWQEPEGNEEVNPIEISQIYTEKNKLYFKREVSSIDERELTTSTVKIPQEATCEPTLELVNFRSEETSDRSYFYSPSCTRVRRCSGCCSDPNEECQPINSITRKFRVYKIDDQGATDVIKKVTEHINCSCRCRIKKCSNGQVLNSNRCLCECPNRNEKIECISDNRRRFDDSTCSCVCIQNEDDRQCNTHQKFDENECTCKDTV